LDSIPWPPPLALTLQEHIKSEYIGFATPGDYNETPPFYIDQKYRRKNPSYKDNAELALIFFGCSFTFSSGVSESKTLPYLTQEHFNNHNFKTYSYNYGIPGGGPNHTLYTIENYPERFDDISEKEQVIIYTYFEDHINRATLNFSHLMGVSLNHPLYDRFDDQNYKASEQMLIIKNIGKYLFYSIAKRSYLLRVILIATKKDITPIQKFHKEDINLTANVIKRIQKRSLKMFPHSHFYVHFLTNDQQMKKALLNLNIKVIEFNKENQSIYDHRLPDHHLNPKGNDLVGKYLFEQIMKKKKNL